MATDETSSAAQAAAVPYYDTEKFRATAPIKSDYVLWERLNAGTSRPASGARNDAPDDDAAEGRSEEPAQKKRRTDKRGQNKARKFELARDEVQLCHFTARELDCKRDNCKFEHDLKTYLAAKEVEILYDAPQIELSGPRVCPLFAETGACSYGYKCRFLDSHLEHLPDGQGFQGTGLRLKLGEKAASLPQEQVDRLYDTKGELNVVVGSTRQRFKASNIASVLPTSYAYLKEIGATLEELVESKEASRRSKGKNRGKGVNGFNKSTNGSSASLNTMSDVVSVAAEDEPTRADSIAEPVASLNAVTDKPLQHNGSELKESAEQATDGPPDVPLRAAEKRRLDFRDQLYLAPLTTVGNLPFRRLCVNYGCDVTCGEMGLAAEYLSGNPSEWALLKRHPSERTFGVQVCGSRPHQLVPAAEAIVKTCPDVDFVDVNCGCPIDLIVNKGAGSALLEHPGKLGKSLVGMSRVLGEVPLTIKLRTGAREKDLVAHKLVGRLREWGVGSVTLHGRTRQQRYSKLADYGYIKQCVEALREACQDDDLPRIPFLGNGDAYDWRDFVSNVENTGVDTVMIARGALIKPWIFTEIKEKRDWDISARERLDGIAKLANFGLAHWGSDSQGVSTTRRFLCEALSFQHRYVPVGLLERLPARLNERPLPYRGRDELETLLSSGSAADWDNIATMFLGKPPPTWTFTPKHKSNSYEANG